MGNAKPARPGTTVLIVDDDPAVTEIFARMLALEGYAVHTALDAETGLQTVKRVRPDAILLDLRMPMIDGVGFLKRLRADPEQRDTPVAIITGDYIVGDGVAGTICELGAVLCFKPLWLEDLVGVTEQLVARRANQSRDDRRLTLLLVDDCVAERALYEMALEPHFEILTADRGDEGIAVATHNHPDAIILDVMMPGLDGWETCLRIKRNPDTQHIPVILLTSLDDGDLHERANAVGASALFHKPYPANQLRDEIHTIVTSH
jgi:CheY-like chemotaxis protein